MELTERETLIKVDQQLQDSIRNQSQIISDLKDFFSRIENESKTVAAISAELRTHRETSTLRWTELDKKLNSLEQSISEITQETNELRDLLTKEKEDRTSADNSEKNEREKFQESINTSFKTTSFILGGVVGIIWLIVTIIEIVRFIKGGG